MEMTPTKILSLHSDAEKYYQAENYEEALGLYQELAEANPYDSELKLRFGYCAAQVGRIEQAIEAGRAALALGCRFPWYVQYELAKLYARSGDKAESLSWLEKALVMRWEDRPAIMEEEAFRPFHGDQHFLRLAGAVNEPGLDRITGWGLDLDYLVEEAQRLHIGFEKPAFSDQFLAMAEALRQRIPTLTNEAIVVEMQRMIAYLGDGHSSLHPFFQTDKIRFMRLPVDFYSFRDGLFIIGGSGDAKQYVGSRVLQFGSRRTEEIVADIDEFISADNAMTTKWMRPQYLILPVYLQAVGAADNDTSVTLTIQDQQSTVREIRLTANDPVGRRQKLWPSQISQNPPPLYLQNTGANYWLQELPDVGALYMQYNQVRDTAQQSIAAFAEHLLETIRITGPTALIVDVRHNNGGNNFLNWPLVRSLVHFETASPDHRLFVLIGRNTFSACQNFVNWLERMTGAIFVGEPTGSRPNFMGESTNVVLPYSGVRASISSRVHYDSFWGDHRPWIAPHIPVELSSGDYFANRDPVLETVLTLIAG